MRKLFYLFLFVALMNFLDGNTTIGITFLLLGLEQRLGKSEALFRCKCRIDKCY